MRRGVRLVLRGFGTFIVVCVAIVALLALIPASTPTIEGANAIASLEAVRIGDVDQWLLMRGRDRSKPVLLYLHGGPGSTTTPFARKFSSRLEEEFVVVHWDQRGAGKSCSSDVPDESLRRDQYVADTLELVAWLRSRFGVEKIYLLGHSWGSFLGVMAVQRQPDLFHAYIGLGQVVDMRRGEEISYRWVVERAKAEGNDQALKQLREIRPPYRSLDDLMLHRSWLGHYGGDYYGGGYVLELVRALLTSSEYTLMEALSYYGCLLNCLEHGWSDLEGIDFIRSVERLDVPVYFFTGRHDYNTPFELVEEWAQVLTAPHVEIVWFDDSAHWASIEEPERFQDELIDRVLAAGVANTRGR